MQPPFALATFIAAVCNKTGNCSAVWTKPPCTHIFFRSRSNLFGCRKAGDVTSRGAFPLPKLNEVCTNLMHFYADNMKLENFCFLYCMGLKLGV